MNDDELVCGGSPPESEDGGGGGAGQDNDKVNDEDMDALLPEDLSNDPLQVLLAVQHCQGQLLDDARSDLAEIRAVLGELREQAEKIGNDHRSLLLAHEELNRLGELHWQEHVIQPIANQVTAAVDIVLAYQSAKRRRGEKPTGADATLRAVTSTLEDLLNAWGIEIFLPSPGDILDSSTMRAIKVVTTDDLSRDNCIRNSIQTGIRPGPRVLRPASVVLWRYESSSQPQGHSN